MDLEETKYVIEILRRQLGKSGKYQKGWIEGTFKRKSYEAKNWWVAL